MDTQILIIYRLWFLNGEKKKLMQWHIKEMLGYYIISSTKYNLFIGLMLRNGTMYDCHAWHVSLYYVHKIAIPDFIMLVS